jgi:hypothetical protein
LIIMDEQEDLEEIEFTPEQKLQLEHISAEDEVEQIRWNVDSLSAPYEESIPYSLVRGGLSTITLGASERRFEKAGAPPTTNPFAETIGETVGAAASFIAPVGAVARGIAYAAPAFVKNFPRVTRLLESSTASGFLEGGIAGVKDEDVLPAAGIGALAGIALEGPFRGAGYAQKSLSGVEHTMLSRAMAKIGLDKGPLDPAREKLTQVLTDAGLSMPGASRPKDWYIDLLEQRASRSSTGRPILQATAERAQRALDRYANDTIMMMGPEVQTGLHVNNAAMGKSLKDTFVARVNSFHDRASMLYDHIFKGQMGKKKVQTSGLVDDLETLLDHWGYDPSAPMQLPVAAQVHGLVKALRAGGKEVSEYMEGASEPIIRLNPNPKPIAWIDARLKVLTGKYKTGKTPRVNPLNPNDAMKLDAASTIREYVMAAVESFSPEHAKIVSEARINWKTYRDLLRHPLAKTLLDGDSADVVDRLFSTPAVIASAREVLPNEVFEVARQRWLANMIYKSRTGTEIAEEISASGVTYTLSGSGLNSKVKELGGIDGETMKAAFADSPEKLKILYELQAVLQQAMKPLKRYKGEAELPGGPQSVGIYGMIKSLFSTVSLPAHLLLTSRIAKNLTAPPAVNRYFGGAMQAPARDLLGSSLESSIVKPAVRGLASAAIR